MPLSSPFNFLHPDISIFGGSDPGIHYRNPATGKLVFLPFGTANSNKVLGVNAAGLPELLNQATFSLADDSVTFAKLQNIPTSTFIGRSTAGTGDPESLTVAQVQALLTLGNAAYRSVGTAQSNLVEVLASGTIDAALIPAQRSHEFVQVADQAARLALTTTQVQPGDEAYQTDTQQTFKLIASPPSNAANWVLISDIGIDGNQIISGIIAPSRLGSGTPNNTNFLRGDGSWTTVAGKDPLSVVTANSALAVNTRVYSNGTTRISHSLPTVAAQGSTIELTDISTNGWRVTQATGQQIFMPDGTSTTLGAAGFIQNPLGDGISTPRSRYCQVKLECIAANNTWIVAQMNSVIDFS